MIPIKIQCSCGQKFAFDVEPVNGRMPNAVTCPACNRTATEAANEQIRQQLARSAPPVAPAPKKGGGRMVLILCVVVVTLIGLAGSTLLFLKSRDKITLPIQPPSSDSKPSTDPLAVAPPPKVTRDPTFVAVGALFDRNLTTRHIEVTRVLAHSPAKKAGIVAGDILLKINDEPIEELRLKEVAEMVFGPVGSKITLEVLQSATGKTNRIEIVREKFHR